MGFDQPSHWLVIVVVLALLFGYKKLPDMARSAGRSMRLFKTEVKGMSDDDDARRANEANQTTAQPTPAQQPAQPVDTTSVQQPVVQAPPAVLPPAAAPAPTPASAPAAPQQTTVTRSSDPTSPSFE